MVEISLIGCGNIASMISNYDKGIIVKAVYDKDQEKSRRFAEEHGARYCSDMDEFLSVPVDVVVEAASPIAVKEVAKEVVQSGKDIMVMSVGGLSDDGFRQEIIEIAKEMGRKIYIPSGAVGGLDAISSAKVGKIEEVVLETTKTPKALGMEIDEKQVIFEGSPSEAIERFPRNINVSVTLAIVAGSDNVKVRIVADPSAKRNTHKVTVRGDVGLLSFTFDNEPSLNLSTSLIAGYSAIALLKRIGSPLQF